MVGSYANVILCAREENERAGGDECKARAVKGRPRENEKVRKGRTGRRGR